MHPAYGEPLVSPLETPLSASSRLEEYIRDFERTAPDLSSCSAAWPPSRPSGPYPVATPSHRRPVSRARSSSSGMSPVHLRDVIETYRTGLTLVLDGLDRCPLARHAHSAVRMQLPCVQTKEKAERLQAAFMCEGVRDEQGRGVKGVMRQLRQQLLDSDMDVDGEGEGEVKECDSCSDPVCEGGGDGDSEGDLPSLPPSPQPQPPPPPLPAPSTSRRMTPSMAGVRTNTDILTDLLARPPSPLPPPILPTHPALQPPLPPLSSQSDGRSSVVVHIHQPTGHVSVGRDDGGQQMDQAVEKDGRKDGSRLVDLPNKGVSGCTGGDDSTEGAKGQSAKKKETGRTDGAPEGPRSPPPAITRQPGNRGDTMTAAGRALEPPPPYESPRVHEAPTVPAPATEMQLSRVADSPPPFSPPPEGPPVKQTEAGEPHRAPDGAEDRPAGLSQLPSPSLPPADGPPADSGAVEGREDTQRRDGDNHETPMEGARLVNRDTVAEVPAAERTSSKDAAVVTPAEWVYSPTSPSVAGLTSHASPIPTKPACVATSGENARLQPSPRPPGLDALMEAMDSPSLAASPGKDLSPPDAVGAMTINAPPRQTVTRAPVAHPAVVRDVNAASQRRAISTPIDDGRGVRSPPSLWNHSRRRTSPSMEPVTLLLPTEANDHTLSDAKAPLPPLPKPRQPRIHPDITQQERKTDRETIMTRGALDRDGHGGRTASARETKMPDSEMRSGGGGGGAGELKHLLTHLCEATRAIQGRTGDELSDRTLRRIVREAREGDGRGEGRALRGAVEGGRDDSSKAILSALSRSLDCLRRLHDLSLPSSSPSSAREAPMRPVFTNQPCPSAAPAARTPIPLPHRIDKMSDAHRSRQGDAAWAATRSDQAVRDPLSQTAYSVASSVSGREASPPSRGHGSGMNNFVPDSSPSYRHRAAADSPLSRASSRRLLIRSSRSCVEASDDGHDATCEPPKTRASARVSPSAVSMRAGEADGRRPAVRQTDEVASARPVSPALAEMAHPRPFDDEIYVHREPTQATFGRRPTHWVYLRPCPSLPMPAPCDPQCSSSNYPPPSGRSLEQDGADASTTQAAWSTLGTQQR